MERLPRACHRLRRRALLVCRRWLPICGCCKAATNKRLFRETLRGERHCFMAQPDAQRISADEVRAVIVDPNKNLDPRHGLVTVSLADSTTLVGLARNQDNFSLQLQTPDGVFHLINKSDIRSLSYEGRSAMPSDYGAILSHEELKDLVSYLLRTSRSENTRKPKNNPEDGDEE